MSFESPRDENDDDEYDLDSHEERTESGSPIYRHQNRDRPWQAPEHPCRFLEEIEAHLQQHVGQVDMVFHEVMSDMIHLDVLQVYANEIRAFHTLVTSGVSDEPMTVPEGVEDHDFVELMIELPPSWPLDQASLKHDEHYWPIRWLKKLGRLPHEYDTWLGWGHSIPNGDPAEPIADTNFVGFVLLPPYWAGPAFCPLTTSEGAKLWFYNMVPLYQEEMDFKLRHGAEALEELFEKHDIDHVVDVGRINVAKKKKRFWFW